MAVRRYAHMTVVSYPYPFDFSCSSSFYPESRNDLTICESPLHQMLEPQAVQRKSIYHCTEVFDKIELQIIQQIDHILSRINLCGTVMKSSFIKTTRNQGYPSQLICVPLLGVCHPIRLRLVVCGHAGLRILDRHAIIVQLDIPRFEALHIALIQLRLRANETAHLQGGAGGPIVVLGLIGRNELGLAPEANFTSRLVP
jgi:hypothetical protein